MTSLFLPLSSAAKGERDVGEATIRPCWGQCQAPSLLASTDISCAEGVLRWGSAWWSRGEGKRISSGASSRSPTLRSRISTSTSCSTSCSSTSATPSRGRHGRVPAPRRGGRTSSWHARRAGSGGVENGTRIPLGRGFAGRVAADRPHGRDRGRRPRGCAQPAAPREGRQSLLGAPPLLVQGPRPGRRPRRDADAASTSRARTQQLLHLAADRAALAIDHGRALRERSAPSAEQPPTPPGRHRPRAEHLSTGDLLELLLRMREILDADTCAILLLDEKARRARRHRCGRARARGRGSCPHPGRPRLRRTDRGRAASSVFPP